MEPVLRPEQLSHLGYSPAQVLRAVRRGDLERVRRGAYRFPSDEEDAPELGHLRLVAATLPQLDSGWCLSHASAALLHDLPVWRSDLTRVHVTRQRSTGGKVRSVVHVHTAPFAPDELTLIDTLPVTSLARTVVDVSRSKPLDWGVATADMALRQGLHRTELCEATRRSARRPGNARARRIALFADPLSESVGESRSRVVLARSGLPTPRLQFEIKDSLGRVVARTDFAWPELRTVGEFDGKVKYQDLLEPGQSASDVVYAEKLREDAIRDLGWQVVRWTWDDLTHPGRIAARLRRAFTRS